MKWETNALSLLESEFGLKAFRAENAENVFAAQKNYSKGTSYRILYDLTQSGRVQRMGRGIYCIAKEPGMAAYASSEYPKITLTELDTKAKSILDRMGIDFAITGPSLLSSYAHLFPRKMIHLVYVMKGAGERVKEEFKRNGLRCLLKPRRIEIKLALEEFPENDLFVIRENLNFDGVSNGVAEFDRALIDTYYEATRDRILFPLEEVGRMISNAFSNSTINVSRLLRLAGRRGIKPEIREILGAAMPDLNLPPSGEISSKVQPVLSVILAEIR